MRAQNRYLLNGYQSVLCAANAHTPRYRDRIYCIWPQIDVDALVGRIYFWYSADRGQSWSLPRAVDTTLPAWATQAQPSIAVNRDGTVGVAWFDTRASRKGDRYDVYFTASRDGGATFLSPVRLSSASSWPMGVGNLRVPPLEPYVSPSQPKATDPRLYTATSAFTSRPQGGTTREWRWIPKVNFTLCGPMLETEHGRSTPRGSK